MRISLCGAAGEVTGSGYLVETARATVLVDFGMFQGRGATDERNRDLGPVVPERLDAVVLTHAHLDHVGRLPLLGIHGLRCPIYGTPATVDFAGLVMTDSARVNESDIERWNRRRRREGKPEEEPLYRGEDVDRVEALMKALPYGERREVAPGVSVRLFEAGHILGSASIEMTIEERGHKRVVIFSGDLGPRGVPILRDPELPPAGDLVFLESTYGDRDHRPLGETVTEFRAILTLALSKKARVLIPAFAIGRTQQLLYHIAELVHAGKLHPVPVYVDSPMAIKATELYRKHQALFDKEASDLVKGGKLERALGSVEYVETAAESKALNEGWDTAVVIAGSGMCEGGRIVHHLRHNLWRRNTAVMMVGYQSEGSLGRRLVDGADEVRIFGEPVVVRAAIHTLNGFSAHAGQSELVEWAGPALCGGKARVVLTHGEERQRAGLRAALKARHGVDAEIPDRGAVITLD